MGKKFICREDELSQKKFIIKTFDDLKDELIIFKDKKGSIKSFSSVCPHLAGEICYKKEKLNCKWHGLSFDENGKSVNGKVKLTLREYKIHSFEGELYIDPE